MRGRPSSRQFVVRRLAQSSAIVLLSAMAAMAARGQNVETAEATQQRRFAIVPTFSASTTLTDNVDLAAANRRSDMIVQLSPGIQFRSNSGRIKGYLNYSLNVVRYAHESDSNEIQHALDAAGTFEAVENWAFIDFAGNISQQSISALGKQSSDNTSINSNRTQASTYSIKPYIRGHLTDAADYEAHVAYTDSRYSTNAAENVKTIDAAARVSGPGAQRAVGWSVDLSRQSFDYVASPTLQTTRLRGTLSYAVMPELKLSVIGGYESQNFTDPNTQKGSTSGWGLDWTPTERTRLSAISENRFFGNSHNISFEHRTPRTVWKYTDTRDLSTSLTQGPLTSLGTVYDLLFTQFASLEPDPVARAALINSFLQKNGVDPNTVVLSSSVANATLVQRRQDLSFAWLGLRDTLTVTVSRSEGERASDVIVVSDDFANSNRIRQRGFSMGLAHRLTPTSVLGITASQENSSSTTDARSSKLRALLLTWTESLGRHTGVSVAARHQRGDNVTGPFGASETYSESALIATLSLRF